MDFFKNISDATKGIILICLGTILLFHTIGIITIGLYYIIIFSSLGMIGYGIMLSHKTIKDFFYKKNTP